ncbi:MAG: ribonuclease H-like domain-containing protein [Smithellaceae bacterium]|nr:ribonuclease H-like domain-containing protein [Smithellaceae bacterium]
MTGETDSGKTIADRAGKISELRQRIEQIMARRSTQVSSSSRQYGEPSSLSDLCPGREISNHRGSCYVARTDSPASTHHGNRRLDAFLSLDIEVLSLLANDRKLRHLAPQDVMFLDTETTGLSGGTGTIAFLIGLGWFEGDTLRAEQIFLRDFSDESAALTYLTEVATDKKFLVTFNGRAFDVGILATRFIMNRLPDPLSQFPHLDLLPPVRRLLGHRLINNRLGTVERELLAVSRHGDVPGYEIPQLYFQWLQRRDGTVIADIIRHNLLDILSMATLTLHLAELTAEPHHHLDHADLLATGRFLFCRGKESEAVDRLRPLVRSPRSEVSSESVRIISRYYKRHGLWEEVVPIWEDLFSRDNDLYPACELAKYYEHKRRDHGRAIEIVCRALSGSPAPTEKERAALLHRLRRLERLATRNAGNSSKKR